MTTILLAVHAADVAAVESLGPGLATQKPTASKGCCDATRADDIWMISTRHLDCPCLDKNSGDFDLEFTRYVGKQWVASSIDEFLTTGDAAQPTLFYVHGNRVDCEDVKDRGMQAYHGLLDCSCAGPLRFVIWSWPSEKVHGQIQDVRAKAVRTDREAHYMAWLLGQMPPDTRTGLVGYSYGARVVTGALHVLGGGRLAGCTLPAAYQRGGGAYNVVLMAAALHNYWLQPDSCHGRALDQVSHLLNQYNPCDAVLKRYKAVERRGRPQALGYTGMCVDEGLAIRIQERDVCDIIGHSHAERLYFESDSITAEARESLLIP